MDRYARVHDDRNTRYDVTDEFISNLKRERELRGESAYRYRVPAMLDQSPARKSLVVGFLSGVAILAIGWLGYFTAQRVREQKQQKRSWFQI